MGTKEWSELRGDARERASDWLDKSDQLLFLLRNGIEIMYDSTDEHEFQERFEKSIYWVHPVIKKEAYNLMMFFIYGGTITSRED